MRNRPRGRTAAPASSAWNLAKTLIQTVVFWGTFLFAIPSGLLVAEDALGLASSRFGGVPMKTAGIAIFLLASFLGLWSGVVMAVHGRGTPFPLDAARELVVAGPYRYVRNPMAIAGLAQGAAVGLYLGSPLVLVYVASGALLWNTFVRRWEESDLEARFGAVYRAYRRRVRCWRPRLRGYDPAAEPVLAAERTAPPGRGVLLYDGDCPFCRRQVRRLLALARPGGIEAVSFRDPGVPDRFPDLPTPALERAMHLVTRDGRVYAGFEAAVRVVATRRMVGSVALLYYLPGIRLLCDAGYSLLAAQRYRLFGRLMPDARGCDACRLHRSPVGHDDDDGTTTSRNGSP